MEALADATMYTAEDIIDGSLAIYSENV